MADAARYVGRRVIQLLLVIWVATTLNFMVPRLIPGDPIAGALAQLQVSGGTQSLDIAAVAAEYNAKFGFDQPLWSQYVNYLGDLVHGDLGVSLLNPSQTVISKIGAAIPWSIGLLLVATLIAFSVGTILGALLAWPRTPRVLGLATTPLLMLSTVPYYLLAIILIYLLAIVFKVFPPGNGFSPTTILAPNWNTAVDIANHAVLPALSIVLGAVGFWALGMRSLMIGVLGEDYITYAESKGLAPTRVFLRYGVRNALLPQVTALALALATVVSGAILVEAIFNYPGLGGLLFSAVLGKDIFVINGVVTVLILTLAFTVFLIDLVYPLIDPRIRH